MRANHEPGSGERKTEIAAAHSALTRGDLAEAQQHVNLAAQHGAPAHETQQLSESIRLAALAQKNRGKGGGWRGFIVAIVGYLILSVRQPLDWGMPVWIFLAFVLVPMLAGLVVGRFQKTNGVPGQSFGAAFKGVGKAMALYTIVHLLLIGGPHSDGAIKWQERIAGVLATLLYSLVAGLVAGAVSMAVGGSVQVKEPTQ